MAASLWKRVFFPLNKYWLVQQRLANSGIFYQRIQHFCKTINKDILKLHERGLFQNVFPPESSSELVHKLLGGSQSMYCGFDPTASSLHIGNLLAIVVLLHCQRVGHYPIALIGGATAKIGDPSGRTSDREQITDEQIKQNSWSIHQSLERIFSNHHQFLWKNKNKKLPDIRILNNADWYERMNVVDFLSDFGRHFRMGDMLAKHSVKTRLNSPEGMNFTEFAYQLFQSYDWLYLHDKYQCTIQIGGNDQLGNIVSGYELISQIHQTKVFGLTTPLVTSSTGDKLGKSAGNAIWLNSDKTSPFDLYQYFLNIPDDEVELLLKLYTFLSDDFIQKTMAKQKSQPENRHGQKILAEQILLLVHGEEGLKTAKRWTEVLFHGNAQILCELSKAEMSELFHNASTTQVFLEPGTTILDTCMKAKCFGRIIDAERVIKAGGVRFNHRRVMQPDHVLISGEHILPNDLTLIRVGKKNHYIVQWLK